MPMPLGSIRGVGAANRVAAVNHGGGQVALTDIELERGSQAEAGERFVHSAAHPTESEALRRSPTNGPHRHQYRRIYTLNAAIYRAGLFDTTLSPRPHLSITSGQMRCFCARFAISSDRNCSWKPSFWCCGIS
jgi:hypothetical protein